jgi:hypothetical protein
MVRIEPSLDFVGIAVVSRKSDKIVQFHTNDNAFEAVRELGAPLRGRSDEVC